MMKLPSKFKNPFSHIKPHTETTPPNQPRTFMMNVAHVFEIVFGFQHRYTKKQWIRFIILFLIIIYFGGLIAVSIVAYMPPSSKKNVPVRITSKDKFIGLTSNIYPLPAAVVNNDVISLRDYYKQISFIKHYQINAAKQTQSKVAATLPSEKELYSQVLENLIDNRLIRQAAKAEKISVSSADIEKTYQETIQGNKELGMFKSVEEALRKTFDMSPEEFKALIGDVILKEKVIQQLLVQVRVSHILVTDKSLIAKIQDAIKKKEDFSKIAKRYSQDLYTQNQGGDLGWLSRQDIKDQISPEFEQAVNKLKVGQISPVFKTKISGKTTYEFVSLTGKRGKIDQSFTLWLDGLRKKAKIIRLIRA